MAKVWPVGRGRRITTGFKVPGGWAAGFHTGVDYAAPAGTPVRSVKRGYVEEVGTTSWGAAYGDRSVIISGPNFIIPRWRRSRVLYAHLESNSVRLGQRVKKGQVIGKVGSRGNSTGPHLHLERRRRPFRYKYDVLDPRRWAAG